MSINIPKSVIFIFAFVVALFLYWPAIQGTPIWDDYKYWFWDPVMRPPMPWLDIWILFAWPFSVTFQRILYVMWHEQYLYYHLLCFGFHFANSLLVYKFARLFSFKYPLMFFFLFLFHPVAVISTAWMIQLKTLLCFFFALLSLLTFMRGNKDTKWMILSWILFACSIFSKSASLTLPLIFLLMSLKSFRFSKLHLLIPFFLLSLFSGMRLLKSPITQAGSEKASYIEKVKDETLEGPVQKEEARPTPGAALNFETIIGPTNQMVDKKLLDLNLGLLLQTMNYYFWQVIIPINNTPVKGLNFEKIGATDYIHLFFIFTLIFIFWKEDTLIYFLGSYILLLPFLGIIPAPFMNVTWVSDQHLYLVLPGLLGFWLKMVDKIKWKYAQLIPLIFLSYFMYKTYETTPHYKNQFTFYEKSLEYNPYNVPIAYNLAAVHLYYGDWIKAYNIVEYYYTLAQTEPQMKKNFYYPNLVTMYLQLKDAIKNAKD